MEIDSNEIKAEDMKLLSKKEFDKLEKILHEINAKYIRMDNDVSKKNKECYEKCTTYIIQQMKEVNVAFKDLFQEVKYTGSFYEGSRVKAANEFDINLVLRKKMFDLSIQEGEAHPGYVRLFVNEQVTPSKSTKDQYKWIQNNFLNADSVNRWLQRILSKVFEKARASGTWITIEGKYRVKILSKTGPAMTLRMQRVNTTKKDEMIDVDFVPVFEFVCPTWPKKARSIPSSCNKKKYTFVRNLLSGLPLLGKGNDYKMQKWYATPKVDYNPLDWRLSFAEMEAEIINHKATLKNVYRLMKGLRDNSTNLGHIKSYYIKTIFLWKAEQLDCSVWTNSLGRVFMMFLFELENCLDLHKIPFFWVKNFNMIDRLRPEHVKDMRGQIANIRKKIITFINAENMDTLNNYMKSLYGGKAFQEELQTEIIAQQLLNLNLTDRNQISPIIDFDFTSERAELMQQYEGAESRSKSCCIIL